MVEAGREEKRFAEERGDFHEGIPAITVVVVAGVNTHIDTHTMLSLV